MSHRRIAAGASLIAAALAGGLLVTQLPANADGAPRVDDVVGVGSDVMQSALNFLADGSTSNPGYNAAGNRNRVFSFDASGDANGRKSGTDPALSADGHTSTALNPTFILRAGTSPVQRPNGGGVGLAALLADGSANRVSFARSPNLPTAAQQAQAQQSVASGGLGTPLHSVQIATDVDYIATATTTNAPSNLSATDLTNIYNGTYTTWGQIPGYSGPAPSATIKALIPQTGAGMRTIFLNGLKAGNGGTTVTVAASVTQVQQNDPTAITSLPAADQPNAIVPFPLGRFNLLGSGYFRNPDQVYSQANPPAALSTTGLKLQNGASAWSVTFPYFVIFRDSALDLGPWQPGGTLNWAQTLFSDAGGPAPFVNTAPGKALLSDAGVTPAYDDRGSATSG
ncbi:MAG: substrate-binding domain-containing protein [Marmoricola sp.]